MKSLLYSLFFLLPALNAIKTQLQRSVRYDFERVVRLKQSQELVQAISSMNLDVWGHAAETVDVMVSTKQFNELRTSVKSLEVVKIVKENVQTLIDSETSRLNHRLNQKGDTDAVGEYFSEYHRYDEIVGFLKNLTKKFNYLVAFTPSIGKSVEGRDIPMIKITAPPTKTTKQKKVVWIQGMQHAREWIAGATVQYLADYLTKEYSANNQRVKKLLDEVEFVLIPVSNPDGYEHTWTKDRLWRKNRQTIKGRKSGVDLNRNWPEHWGEEGSSDDPSSQTYAGPYAASEPEVQALMKEFKKTKNICGAIDMHSYSQLLLRPYGWTKTASLDEDKFVQLHEAMKQDIYATAKTDYIVQPGVDLYFVAGGSRDWFYDNATKVGEPKKYSMTIELSPDRDADEGFILPPQRIIPVGKEMVPALLRYAETCYQQPLGLKTQADADLK